MEILKKALSSIEPLDQGAIKKAWHRLDNLTKPIGSLGTLEHVAARISGITGKVKNTINKKNIIIMCADNGIVEEGVTTNPQEFTAIVTNNFTKGITGINVLSKFAGSDIEIVNIGVTGELNNPLVLDRKVMDGTKNMIKGPAMTREECIKAIEVGIEVVDGLVAKGYDLLGTGEMGIGNTTTSAAVLSVFSGMEADIIAGRGSGLLDEQFNHKKRVIKECIKVNAPNVEDPIDVLSKVGGLDIAGLCGCFIGAAKNRVPIVIDGFISAAAALCAYKLNPLTKEYMIPSHLSAEPGAKFAMDVIGLEPMFDLKMRLGEGTGCPLAFNVIEAALYTVNNMGTFDDAKLDSTKYVDMR